MGLFDNVQDLAFNAITNTFGTPATWQPVGGEDIQNAQVLYKDPSEAASIGDADYDIDGYVMEYMKGDFEGLKLSVDRGNLETVSITMREGNDIEFYVRKCTTKYDGRTIVAKLNTK